MQTEYGLVDVVVAGHESDVPPDGILPRGMHLEPLRHGFQSWNVVIYRVLACQLEVAPDVFPAPPFDRLAQVTSCAAPEPSRPKPVAQVLLAKVGGGQLWRSR